LEINLQICWCPIHAEWKLIDIVVKILLSFYLEIILVPLLLDFDPPVLINEQLADLVVDLGCPGFLGQVCSPLCQHEVDEDIDLTLTLTKWEFNVFSSIIGKLKYDDSNF
jgi:hypothetical protein